MSDKAKAEQILADSRAAQSQKRKQAEAERVKAREAKSRSYRSYTGSCKTCKTCEELLDLGQFEKRITPSGIVSYRGECFLCRNKKRRKVP